MLGLGLTFPEALVAFFLGIIYAIPIVAVIWIILTLRRIRSDHEAIQSKLEAIERLLQRISPS